MGFIDGTVTSIAMPAIRATLGATLADAQWINNAYMVALAALILVGGAFADRFGLARIFGLGIALFMATSLICAIAPNVQTLIVARFAQGIGAALMVPGSLAIVSRAYPREERGAAIGTWAAFSALTTALGPIIGGIALSLGGPDIWRWIFAINLPIGLVALLLLKRGVTQDAARPDQPVDLGGAILATTALGLLAWALISTETKTDNRAVVFACLGVGVFAGFLFHEHRTKAPMMPLSLFQNRLFAAANAATFLLYFSLSAILFYLPMLVISAWNVSEIEAAAAFAPLSVFITLFSKRFGRLSDRIGPAPVIAMGSMAVAVGYGWLAVAVVSQNYWLGVLPPMSLAGFGMAMVVAPLSTAVMASVADTQTGLASGVNNAISRAAGLTAVAALGGFITRAYANAGGTAAYGIVSATDAHAAAMTSAFSTVAWMTCAVAGCAALVAAAIGRRAGR